MVLRWCRCFRCSMLGECDVTHFENPTRNNKTHQHKRSAWKWKRSSVVAMVIDNRTQAHRKAENISSRSCTFLSPFGRFCQNCRDYIACASNEITLHRAVSFTASQLNGLFSLLFFRSLHWGLQRFYGQNSCFSEKSFSKASQQFFFIERGAVEQAAGNGLIVNFRLLNFMRSEESFQLMVINHEARRWKRSKIFFGQFWMSLVGCFLMQSQRLWWAMVVSCFDGIFIVNFMMNLISYIGDIHLNDGCGETW